MYKVFFSVMKIYKENHVNEFFQRFQQTLCFGDICGDCIKDVDQNKKDCNQKRHPGKVLFKLSKTF